MRSFPVLALACALLLVAPAASPALGGSTSAPLDVVGDVETATQDLRTAADALQSGTAGKLLLTPGKVLAQADKSLASFAKAKFRDTAQGELKVLFKESKRAERKLLGRLGDAGLGDEENALVDAYREAWSRARLDVGAALAIAQQQLPPTRRNKRKLRRAQRALVAVDATGTFSVAFKKLKTAASAVAEQLQQYLDDREQNEPDPDDVNQREASWVISSIRMGASNEGVDLNGDGDPDNQFAILLDSFAGFGVDIDIDQQIEDALLNTTAPITVPIIHIWGFTGFEPDPSISVGLLTGLDQDDDPSDNYSGFEEFDASAGTAEDGRPVVRAPSAFTDDGMYEFSSSTTDLSALLPGLPLDGGGVFGVRGHAQPDRNDGVLGAAIPVEILEGVVDQILTGIPAALAKSVIRSLADVDRDGNGDPDALSAAFVFESVPCRLAPLDAR